MTLWDGRAYCRKCVEQVSPELYDLAAKGARLEETVDRQDIRAIHYIRFLGPYLLCIPLLLSLLMFGLDAIDGKPDLELLVAMLVLFGGGGGLILCLQAAIGALGSRSRLPRTVFVEDGDFTIVVPGNEKRVRLADCTWFFGATSGDQLCMFSKLHQGVVIQASDQQIGCGHTSEALEHWRAFLTLAGVPRNPPCGCLRLIAITVAGMIMGALVGAGMGHVVSLFTRNDTWIGALGLMGAMEGAVVAILWGTCMADGAESARERLHPAGLALLFGVIGALFGIVGEWTGIVVCGTVSALFGVVVARCCRWKIQATQAEHKRNSSFLD